MYCGIHNIMHNISHDHVECEEHHAHKRQSCGTIVDVSNIMALKTSTFLLTTANE